MKRVSWRVVVGCAAALCISSAVGVASSPAAVSAGGTAIRPAVVGTEALYRGESLVAGQQLVSQYGRYRLSLGADRNLVLNGPLGRIWGLSGVYRLTMESNGYLRAYGATNNIVWSQGGGTALQLRLSSNGKLALEGTNQTFVVATTERWVWIASAANGNRLSLSTSAQGFDGFEVGTLMATSASPKFTGAEPFVLFGDCAVKCAIMPRKWWSTSGGYFVSAVAKWSIPNTGPKDGQLIVTSSTVGSRELFQFVGNCTTGCGIKSLGNGKYASAEFGYWGKYYGMLVARATSVSSWEKFTVVSF